MPAKKKRVYNKSTGRTYKKGSYDGDYNAKNSMRRSKQNQARRVMKAHLEKKYGKAKAASMMKNADVAHKKPLRSGGTNKISNLKLQSPSKNRGRAGEGGRKKGRKRR